MYGGMSLAIATATAVDNYLLAQHKIFRSAAVSTPLPDVSPYTHVSVVAPARASARDRAGRQFEERAPNDGEQSDEHERARGGDRAAARIARRREGERGNWDNGADATTRNAALRAGGRGRLAGLPACRPACLYPA